MSVMFPSEKGRRNEQIREKDPKKLREGSSRNREKLGKREKRKYWE